MLNYSLLRNPSNYYSGASVLRNYWKVFNLGENLYETKKILQTLSILPIAGVVMKLNDLYKASLEMDATEKIPVLF